MTNVTRCGVVLLVCVLIVGAVASCGQTATPIPALPPTATPVPAAPTAAPAAEAVAPPTPAPPEEPTATPVPELVGTPTSPDEMPRIGLEELKALMDSGANLVILDNRPKESYQLGHIEGAISFPWKPQLTMADAELLPWDDPIITYCDCGPGEADSASVAFQLMEFGLEDIKVLIHPAIEGWTEAGYPTE